MLAQAGSPLSSGNDLPSDHSTFVEIVAQKPVDTASRPLNFGHG